jgi:serine/threonine protein phosphatase PrpC
LKKIDDKQKYDSTSQLKTLVVMQVLGNSRSFFDNQQQLNDRVDFFTDTTLPDAVISDNSIAGYFLFMGSDGLMNEMIDSQYK